MVSLPLVQGDEMSEWCKTQRASSEQQPEASCILQRKLEMEHHTQKQAQEGQKICKDNQNDW